MSERLSINTKWIQNKIFWSLLLIPLCFKLEILPGLIILPQEIILPFLIILYLISRKAIPRLVSKILLPYIYLLLAFGLTIGLTLISLFQKIDIIGLLKLIKYSIYVFSIIIIYDYRPRNFVKKINIIAIITILLTLIMFYLNKVHSGKLWSNYVQMATYIAEYMPTGFSNRIFSFQSHSFVIYSGNHGIYGSYLTLILFFNISGLLRGMAYRKLSYFVTLFAFINIMLLTSRETFLLIFITVFLHSLYRVTFIKFNPFRVLISFILFMGFVFIVLWLINFYNIELSIVNKMANSIRKFKESGGDGSVNVRFNTWLIIIIYLISNPWRIFIGTGFNPTLFREKLDFIANLFPNQGEYVGIPESLFIQFLAYGGILSLLFIMLFMFHLFKNLLRQVNTRYCMFIPFFILGLIVTNNTGASIIAELLMTQLGLIYLFIMNFYEEKKHLVFNGPV